MGVFYEREGVLVGDGCICIASDFHCPHRLMIATSPSPFP